MELRKSIFSINNILFILFILLLFFSGVLKNLLGISSQSSIFIIFYFSILFLSTISLMIRPNIEIKLIPILIPFILFVSSTIIVFIIGDNNLYERILGTINFTIYMFIWLIVIALIEYKNVYFYIKLLSFLLIIFSIIGIFQTMFGYALPLSFLSINSIKLLPFADAPDIIRATGMIGNSLEFAGFSLIAFSIWYSRWIFTPRHLLSLILSLIAVAAVLSSYSRAAIASIIIIVILTHILHFSINKRICRSGLLLLSSIPFLIGTIYIKMNTSFLLQRFTSNDVNTIQSNQMHLEDYQNAISAISDNLLFGIGIGSQGVSALGSSKIITDGFFFQLFLEYGILSSLFYILFIISLLLFLYKNIQNIPVKSHPTIIGTLIIIIILHINGFFNSSLLAPINLIVTFLFIGLSSILIINESRRYE